MSEKIEPCPNPECRGDCSVTVQTIAGRVFQAVTCRRCGYVAGVAQKKHRAIAMHDRLCRLVRYGRAAEELIENPPVDWVPDDELRDTRGVLIAYNNGIMTCIQMLKAALEER